MSIKTSLFVCAIFLLSCCKQEKILFSITRTDKPSDALISLKLDSSQTQSLNSQLKELQMQGKDALQFIYDLYGKDYFTSYSLTAKNEKGEIIVHYPLKKENPHIIIYRPLPSKELDLIFFKNHDTSQDWSQSMNIINLEPFLTNEEYVELLRLTGNYFSSSAQSNLDL